VHRDRRHLLSAPVPRWFSLLCVLFLIGAGVSALVVLKSSSGGNLPAAAQSAVSATVPPNGIAGITPQTAPAYTVLVLQGEDLSNLNLPGVQPWRTGGDVAQGQVGTIGDILLCAAGRPSSLRIVSVAALRGAHPLKVVGFSTRPEGTQDLGFGPGSLSASGFPSTGAEVPPCHGTYQQALIGVHSVVTTELGVAFEMTGSYQEEDNGLIITYQDSEGTLRTLDVPIDVLFCARSTDPNCD